MQSPFFSIIIPTHNRSQLLGEAIRSVLTQTFEDFELIVVDDHSIDNTREVVTSFSDHRISYKLNDRSRGGAGARNAGILRAEGKWVAFLDDDDIWLPKKLESVYKKIQHADCTVGVVYSGSAVYDFVKKRRVIVKIPEKEGWIQSDQLYKNYIDTFSRVVIRNDVLRSVGGLDERFESLQDAELYIRLTSICKVLAVKEILTYTRDSNRDRITYDLRKKLDGNLLIQEKYEYLTRKNPCLRHRAASRVFVFAAATGSIGELFRALPWTFAGLIYDNSNFVWTFKTLLGLILLRYRHSRHGMNCCRTSS
jgi:glycosyltransferase involved in cell wall biosynthesis